MNRRSTRLKNKPRKYLPEDALADAVWENKSAPLWSTALEKANEEKTANTKIIIAVDESVDINDFGKVFFNFCACVDPSRDTHQFSDCIGFDGTTKMQGDERNGYRVRQWPPPLLLD